MSNTSTFRSAALKWVAILLALPGLAFAGEQTVAEKVKALADAGKTIPVLDATSASGGKNGTNYGGSFLSAVSIKPPGQMETPIMDYQPVPADYRVISDEIVKTLNAGFGVTNFKTITADQIPFTESMTKGDVADWAKTDYDMNVTILVSGKYVLSIRSGSRFVQLFMHCEVKVAENVLKANGKKKSSNVRTMSADTYSKNVQVRKNPETLAAFESAVPAGSMTEPLTAAILKEIAEFIAK